MRRILISILMLLPLAMTAQNTWEKPMVDAEQTQPVKKEKVKKGSKQKTEDLPYLKGAVKEVDGYVEWDTTICVPGKTAEQLYDIMLKYMTALSKQKNQSEQSNVALVNKNEHQIVTCLQEKLVFASSFISLDQTDFRYTLLTSCRDGQVDVKMYRLSYVYDVNGKKTQYKAEEWITDQYAVNKKNTRLLPISGKFRRKTIDRKSFLFTTIKETLER